MSNSFNIYNTSLFNDAKVNILWFSDIHYLDEEKQPKEDFFNSFKISFVEKCKQLNEYESIDYVIISGDLAQSGKTSEYESFYNDILKPLFNNLKKAKLLIIPGNHDLTYDHLDVNLYLTTSKKDYLKKIEKHKLFKNYLDFFSQRKEHFSKEMSINYLSTFYNGYLVDYEKKIIFVLLNSSWLSYSVKILEYYIKNKITKNDLLDDDKILKHAIDIYKKTLEFGEQLLALEETFNSFDSLVELIKKHPEFIVVNIKHHPENWLKWEERLDLKDSNYLKQLNESSHVFLDSHEHVRKGWKPNQNKQKQLFLKSGAFIELEYENNQEIIVESNLDNSLFHLISINSTRKTINFKNFAYSSTTKWDEFNENSNLNFKLQKEIIPPLNESYRRSIIDKIHSKTKSSGFNLIKKLFSDLLFNSIEEDNNLAIFGNDLLVFQKNNIFEFYDYELIISNNIKNIYFICIDLLIDNDIYDNKLYNMDRDFALGNLKNDLEAKFNRYRTIFFNSEIFKKNHISNIEFEALKLNLVLLPYWKIHNIL